jgi:hypothetical protein
MPSRLKIIEGPVSQDSEHISISYGSVGTDKTPFPTVARLSSPRNDVITLELVADDSTIRGQKIIVVN